MSMETFLPNPEPTVVVGVSSAVAARVKSLRGRLSLLSRLSGIVGCEGMGKKLARPQDAVFPVSIFGPKPE